MSLTNFLGKIYQRIKPLKTTKPYLDIEFGITTEALYKRIKTLQYTPDKLLSRKKIQIFNEMILDSEIESAVNTLKVIRLSSGWEIENGGETDLDKEIADFVRWNLENIEGSFDDDLREIMGALEMGISLSELVWYVIPEGKWKGKIGLKALKSKNPKYFNIWVDDFDNIREFGVVNISSIEYGKEYPTEKFVIYSFNKRYENVFGTSRLRSLYDLWFLKQVWLSAWGIFLEKYGHPFPILKHPPLDDETKKKLLEVIRNIKLETGLMIPQELELQFAEVGTRSGNLFRDAIEFINQQIRKVILGQTLTAETTGVGSYSLGKVHFDILLFYEEQLGKDIEVKAINPQVIKRLVDYNFTGFTDYPKFRFKPLVKQDIEKVINLYYQGVGNGVIKPIPEDEEKIRDWLGFPKRKVEVEPSPAVKNPDLVVQDQENTTYSEEAIGFQERLFTGVRRRTFTPYEKFTDFSEIKSLIEDTTDELVIRVGEIIKKAVDDLISQIGKKKIIEEKNFIEIDRLHLKYVGDIKREIADYLKWTFKEGMRQARREITAKKKELRFQEIDLRNITPEEALEYLDRKAFFMAGVERDYILKEVKTALYNGLKTGATLKDMVEDIQYRLETYLQRGLVGDEALRSARLETIVRTNLNEALNEGRKAFFQAPELKGYVQAYQYSAILDDRVRPNHARMDGRIYPVNHPVWDLWTPPNGFNCRCILIPITEDEEWEQSPYPLPAGLTPDPGFEKPGQKRR